jgi:hypothetical protein
MQLFVPSPQRLNFFEPISCRGPLDNAPDGITSRPWYKVVACANWDPHWLTDKFVLKTIDLYRSLVGVGPHPHMLSPCRLEIVMAGVHASMGKPNNAMGVTT